MNCCQLKKDIATKSELMKNYDIVKEYDPQPKNKDGSIRWFLYRWDDGKNGVRRLARCKHCGCVFLIQAYRLNKFSEYADVQFEDWYPIGSEIEADYANQNYTGLQWELEHRPVLQCKDEAVVCLG